MKRFLLKLLAFAAAVGLAVLALKPVVARQRGLEEDARIARAYLDAAQGLSLLDCGTLLGQALEYDAARGIEGWADPAEPAANAPGNAYAALLDPSGNGVMSVLEIPKLGVMLPVYHGGEDAVPGAGVTHLPGSSLPVGGANGKCVLLARQDGGAYRPLSALDRLIPGDCFSLHTLQDTFIYEVYAAPETSPGADGADECALTTLSSRGTTVYGRRVSRRSARPADDTRAVPGWIASLVFAAPVAALGLVALAIVEGPRKALRRRKRRRMRL